jgi:hypothetical protein
MLSKEQMSLVSIAVSIDDREVGKTYFRATLTIEEWKAEQQLS